MYLEEDLQETGSSEGGSNTQEGVKRKFYLEKFQSFLCTQFIAGATNKLLVKHIQRDNDGNKL